MLSLGFAQAPSMIFYNGAVPDDMYLWPWGFNLDPEPVPGTGYTPGTDALRWVTTADDGWQGVFIGLNSNEGLDMSSIWATDSVYFKLKAPNGLSSTDSLLVYIYDSRNSDWEYSVYQKLENFHDLNDGNWHQFSLALADFENYNNPINQADIVAVSFEAPIEGSGIATEFYIDHVWMGHPMVRHNLVIWNGKSTPAGVGTELWGFQDNGFKTAIGEGYDEGTDAILWENGQDDWAGIGFYFENQDLTGTWIADSLKIKINAPAGINDPYLVLYDPDWNYAYYGLSDISWDDTWKDFSIALADFSFEGEVDLTRIYYFSVESWTAIPQRFLIDNIWIGNPLIDYVAPMAPENIIADVSSPYVNLISWDDVADESGETYDVYASLDPITDLGDAGVFLVATDVPEQTVAVHYIYYPLEEGEVSYYYAVTCTDPAGNVSESFGKTDNAYSNTGEARPIISMNVPQNFSADGDLSEWAHIMPFTLDPDNNPYTGTIDNAADYSAFCYVAMDNENLYVAFDVYDDIYTWDVTNTQPWWEDEGIEFFIGLYEAGVPHPYFYRGAEPDYRLLFLPNGLYVAVPSFDDDSLELGPDNYYFEPLGSSDYIIEAKIPLASIQREGDSTFVPVEGMTVPFEIFAADADVPDGGNESRLQYGPNPTLNPWGAGPKAWTFTWIGMPGFVAIDREDPVSVKSYYLADNYPNPFNPMTVIEYSIAEPAHVELIIYNTLGQKVKTLVNENRTAGVHRATFDATNLASGVYYYQISSDKFNQVKKMLLLK